MSQSLSQAIEKKVLRSIKEKRPSLFLRFLYVLSLGFRVVTKVRHWLYDRAIYSSTTLKIPVISVGNIVAGGTGKTPTVMALLDMLKEKRRIAVISSGYRRTLNENRKIDADSPEDVRLGDEPFLIASLYPEVGVFSTKDYLRTAREIEASGNYDLIILDDGFQKRKLVSTLSIVCMRGDDLWGEGYFLPRGFLRDDPARLVHADIVLLTGFYTAQVESEIRLHSNALICGAKWDCERPEALDEGDRVGVFCGIGNPEQFVQSVRGCDLTDVAADVTVDHGVFRKEKLEEFSLVARAKGAKALVCTAKDAVKIEAQSDLALPVYVLIGKLKISYGISDFHKLLDRMLTNGTRV